DVAGHHIANAARGLAAQHHRAMPAMDSAVGDGYVLGYAIHAPAVHVFAALQADRVVSGIEVRIGNADVAATVHVHAVGVGAGIALHHHVPDHHVFAIERVQHPHGAALDVDAFDQDILALHRPDEIGAQAHLGGFAQVVRYRLLLFE